MWIGRPTGDFLVGNRGQSFLPPAEISGGSWGKLKQFGGDYSARGRRAVITVAGLTSTTSQRQAHQDAGRIAGLTVIGWPRADGAALAYGLYTKKDQRSPLRLRRRHLRTSRSGSGEGRVVS